MGESSCVYVNGSNSKPVRCYVGSTEGLTGDIEARLAHYNSGGDQHTGKYGA